MKEKRMSTVLEEITLHPETDGKEPCLIGYEIKDVTEDEGTYDITFLIKGYDTGETLGYARSADIYKTGIKLAKKNGAGASVGLNRDGVASFCDEKGVRHRMDGALTHKPGEPCYVSVTHRFRGDG
jgi:hypothetical protein